MFGYNQYAAVPYGILSNNIIYVAACIHIDSQKIYDCTLSTSLIYTAEIYHSMVYLTDVNIVAGEC